LRALAKPEQSMPMCYFHVRDAPLLGMSEVVRRFLQQRSADRFPS